MSFAIGVNQTEKKKAKNTVRDLSEISRGEGGVGILNLGSEIK